MKAPKIKSTAVLIGYDTDGRCVYSEILDLVAYYDGEHVWDKAATIKKLKLHRIHGFLFDPRGNLEQEFENDYDPTTGLRKSGRIRFADGTEHVFT
jgi:hypothetical protein